MIVKSIKIKNFKSFGNNTNEINLDPNKGELILMTGLNGSGKSATIDGFDFALYGKVRGKRKKYITGESLPNRFNGDMSVEIEFETNNNNIKIIRGTNKLELYINHQKYDRAGKANVQQKIEEIVGIDIDTFKSFISMSINDFKNFMVLTPEEKRMLLDRLFNLEMINELSKILKEKKKQNKHKEDLFLSEINSYQTSLNTFKESVEKMKAASKQNLSKEREEVKNIMLGKKEEFESLKERLNKASEKEQILTSKIKETNKKINDIDYQLRSRKEKIKLFDLGKCPTCESDLSTDAHSGLKHDILEVINSLEQVKAELSNELLDTENKNIQLTKIIRNTQQNFGELKSYLSQLKEKLESLKEDNTKEVESINEIITTIDKIEYRKDESINKLSDTKHVSDLLNQLDKLFSEEGIKKSIITKIVKPINHFIKENLEKLNLPFTVYLDDQFSAVITLLGQEIDIDSLSTGETKKINIAIMLAYLKLIRMKKHINLLFLDEVFSSIDVSGIYDILNLLKDFAREYNINTFMIHHAMLEKSYFDRILKIEKNITSQITIE